MSFKIGSVGFIGPQTDSDTIYRIISDTIERIDLAQAVNAYMVRDQLETVVSNIP